MIRSGRPNTTSSSSRVCCYRDDGGEWIYDGRWAHDLDEQQRMIKGLVEFFARAARDAIPSMHVYHYNHTEKSTIERLMRDDRGREPLREPRRDRASSLTSSRVAQERRARRHRVLRPEVARTPRRIRAQRGHRARGRRRRGVRGRGMRRRTPRATRATSRATTATTSRRPGRLRDWLVEHAAATGSRGVKRS